jgi:hypothetical protein
MASNFWNNAQIEPKRNFRFIARIGNFPNMDWIVQTVDKPKFEISNHEHKYLNHTFNYPGRLKWQPISLTLVDPVSPVDTAATVMSFARIAGYDTPSGDANSAQNSSATNMTKARAVGALGDVTISQLGTPPNFDPSQDHMERIVDQWSLVNAFVQGTVDFGKLDYNSEELTTLSMTLMYDYAYMSKAGGQSGGIHGLMGANGLLGIAESVGAIVSNIDDLGGNNS